MTESEKGKKGRFRLQEEGNPCEEILGKEPDVFTFHGFDKLGNRLEELKDTETALDVPFFPETLCLFHCLKRPTSQFLGFLLFFFLQ